uniref:Protein bicaudal D n=1 Tax=Syphacia muris TaxID=451379 RepID=A0A0N5ARH3_9BILA
MEIDELRDKIARLSTALEEATAERTQAAQYGLQVMDEKQQLEAKFLQLQARYDAARAEIDETKKALAQFQSQQKSVTISDIDHEETLLEETATREQTHLAKIAQLENELRNAQKECKMNRSDMEKLQTLYASNSEMVKDLVTQKRNMREELKDLKAREQRLLNDYAELEEENIGLQKQASNLRSAQVEFEAMKMEVKRLLDENDQLLADGKEANQLTLVTKKQLEDALLNIQLERDQKLAYKKELDQMRNAEHLQQLNSMLFGFQSSGDEDSQALKKLESSFIADENGFGKVPSKGADLFSEINGDMEEKVSKLETKNDELSSKLKNALRDIAFIAPLLKKLEVTTNAEIDHNQLKQLCELALTKVDELSLNAAKAENGEKSFDSLKSDLRTSVMTAGAYHARIAAAQV